jgi:rhodanese-related sulfurtransferase
MQAPTCSQATCTRTLLLAIDEAGEQISILDARDPAQTRVLEDYAVIPEKDLTEWYESAPHSWRDYHVMRYDPQTQRLILHIWFQNKNMLKGNSDYYACLL